VLAVRQVYAEKGRGVCAERDGSSRIATIEAAMLRLAAGRSEPILRESGSISFAHVQGQFLDRFERRNVNPPDRNNREAHGTDPKVYIVHLRRPNSARVDPHERRSDPFWEFGSFGCTGCHSNNLFHPKRATDLEGARLAFAQGGSRGFRLVLLTPPVSVRNWDDRLEARWKPAQMPFRYEHAPVLAANDRPSDFPVLERFVLATARTSIEGGFSSRFRSRAEPLDDRIAKELIRQYQRLRSTAPPHAIATSYEQALSQLPPLVDRNRRQTYRALIERLEDVSPRSSPTGVSRCESGAAGSSANRRRRC
jgi:hypothetical protein